MFFNLTHRLFASSSFIVDCYDYDNDDDSSQRIRHREGGLLTGVGGSKSRYVIVFILAVPLVT